jgi:trans-aconitate methyltransferase
MESMVLYEWKVRALASASGDQVARRWHGRKDPRSAWAWEDFVRTYAPGRTVLDVGGMYGANGSLSFEAERVGAQRVTCVDLYASDEFTATHTARSSQVRMVVGDLFDAQTTQSVEPADVVFCLGVFYHVPDPAGLMARLADLSTETLLLEGLTAPEVRGSKQMALYLPHLEVGQRRRWETGVGGLGIRKDFIPEMGYANNFWIMTPSCVCALLETAGFRTEAVLPSPSGRLRHLFIARRA